MKKGKDDSAAIGTIKDILQSLKETDVKGKLKMLADSKLAATISNLTKCPYDATISSSAASLKKDWKALVAQSQKAKEGGGSAAKPAAKMEVEAAASSGAAKTEVKPEVKPEVKAEVKAEVKSEPAAGASSSLAPEELKRMESMSAVDWRPVPKTGDPTRDMVRAKLQEAFDKGKIDNAKYLHEISVDTAAMATEAESRMNEVLGGSASKEYKARFRSLAFNLKDPKNPHFLQRVITGQIFVNDLADMEVKDMASDEMKKARHDALEHAKMALMDDRTYRNYAGKATQDGILKCPRCKSMKTEYVEVQTRSADEPTTKKCNCNDCDYRWKFC